MLALVSMGAGAGAIWWAQFYTPRLMQRVRLRISAKGSPARFDERVASRRYRWSLRGVTVCGCALIVNGVVLLLNP